VRSWLLSAGRREIEAEIRELPENTGDLATLVVTLTAGSKRRSLLMAGDDDEHVYGKKSSDLNVTPKTTERHFIVRSDKSVAYVTNNKRLHSTFCTVEAD